MKVHAHFLGTMLVTVDCQYLLDGIFQSSPRDLREHPRWSLYPADTRVPTETTLARCNPKKDERRHVSRQID